VQNRGHGDITIVSGQDVRLRAGPAKKGYQETDEKNWFHDSDDEIRMKIKISGGGAWDLTIGAATAETGDGRRTFTHHPSRITHKPWVTLNAGFFDA
jgi:hypothetical protein